MGKFIKCELVLNNAGNSHNVLQEGNLLLNCGKFKI